MSVVDPNEVAKAIRRLEKPVAMQDQAPEAAQQAPSTKPWGILTTGGLGNAMDAANPNKQAVEQAWIKEREAERAERQTQRDEEMRAMCLNTATQQLHARPADEIVQYAKSLFEFIKGRAGFPF